MKTGWILCDKGKIGTYRQCLALANLFEKEYGIQFIYKSVSLNLFWRYLPPHFARWKKTPHTLQNQSDNGLYPPYPDLVIAAWPTSCYFGNGISRAFIYNRFAKPED
jgi:mitochondrial fission protein ELM1